MSQNVEDIYPLTPLQEGMLFHTLGAPGTGVYIERLSCDLRGDLDPAAFRRAWEEVVARHPVLRTAFLWQGLDRPMQVVRRTVRLPWREEDWRDVPAEEREARLASYLDDDLRQGFDPMRAPLLRLALFRTAERTWRLVFAHHHLLLDGWGRVHVLRDVLTLYEAARRGLPVRLEPVRPFRDYVAWLVAQDLGAAEAFWRRTLAGFAAPTPLPGGRGRAAGSAEDQGEITLELTAEETAALQERARSERITLNTLVQAAWAVLLARGSGEEDVVYGSVVSGRPAALPGAEAMVGSFINTLPVRARLDPDEPAGAFLRRFQDELAAQRRFEHAPLVQVQAWSEVPRGTPLFETLVVFENHPTGGLSGGGGSSLEIADVLYEARAHYPLSLAAIPVDRLALRLQHERRRIDEAKAHRLLGRLRALLAGFAAEPGCPVGQLPFLPDEERREVLAWSIGTAVHRPLPAAPLHALFAARAAAAPEAVAVEHEGESLTYGELHRRSTRLARHLRALGVAPDVLVGVLAERSPELIVGMLGILEAGGAYLLLDPAHPAERLATILEDAGAPLLLVQEHLATRVPPTRARTVLLGSSPDVETGTDPGVDPALGHLACVIYTSGSTGVPKGVGITHRNVLDLLFETDYAQLGPDDVMAQISSPAFDAATFEIWGALLFGARLSILGRYDTLQPAELVGRLRERGVTTLLITTALFNKVAREVPGAFAGLRYVLFGGEAVDAAAVRAVMSGGPPDRLLHSYGPTESTTLATWHLVRTVPEGAETVPIGGPTAGTRALVLDRWGGLAPAGAPGELCLGGDGLARGYLGRPDLTAARFVPDAQGEPPGARLYRTGDLVRWVDGALEFLGRTDHQVKIRGFRIEPGEIEAVLREQAAVREALVAALPDPAGGRRLVAWWVRQPGSGETEAGLRAALRARLPEPMIPAAFVEMAELPLNVNGKVDRTRLPHPEEVERPAGEETGGEAPRTQIEELLAGIEAAVLGRERVGLHDSFLDLGGHSLLATQLVSRVREAFGVDLPLAAVFEEPTVAGLAGRLETLLRAGQGVELPPLERAPRTGPFPLSFAQERLWFLDQIDPGTPAYNIPLAVRLRSAEPSPPGPLSHTPSPPTGRGGTPSLAENALSAALDALVERHEALRTRFATGADGRPVQLVDPWTPEDRLALVDLAGLGLPDERWESLVREIGAAEAARRFDLEAGPLVRAVLLRRSASEHVLLLTLHHIVADGWSMGVLVGDLGRAYTRLTVGEAPDLSPLPVQYPDFAVWQRRCLEGEPLRELVAWWRESLAGAPPRLELPTDRPAPAVQTFRGGTRPFVLPAGTDARLRALGRSERVTPFMLLLGGLAVLLHRYSGQDDLLVGTPVAGRTRMETEGLIGFFVNTLVLRVQPAEGLTLRRFLERVRATSLAAYAHQDLPFEKLVEELQPHRDLGYTPFFQVLFALQNAPMGRMELPGLALETLGVDSGTAKFALTLSLADGEDGLAGSLEFNRDLFDAATIDRLAGHLQSLLGAFAEPATRRLEDLPLLTDEERHQLLTAWNDIPLPPVTATLPELFAAQAARTPDAPALIARGEHLTYCELARRVDLLAAALRAHGVGPEVPVGLLAERTAALPVAALAILTAGGAYVPLDPAWPQERREFMLRDSGAPLLVAQEGLEVGEGVAAILVDEHGEPSPPAPLPQAGEGSKAKTLDPAFAVHPSPTRGRGAGGEGHLAYLIYTSGSTGLPKGVAITHGSVAAFLAWAGTAFSREELSGVLAATSICFDLSVFELFAPLVHGGCVILAANALELAEMADASAVTLINTVPSALAELLRLDALPPGPVTVNLAGEPLQAALVAGLYARPQVTRVLNLYGPSEDTTYSTGCVVDRDDPAPPIGRPVGGSQVYLVDRAFRPVPAGVPGELCLGGAGLARGYFGRPDLTAERFVPDLFSGEVGARLYRTGDLARWRSDRQLAFLGRADRQVKIRGFRIEPGEIEARLARHPAVREAAAGTVGEGSDRRLVAWVAPAAGTEMAPQELRAFLREGLPEHMVPTEWVALAALPLTPNGKIDRRALPAPGGPPAAAVAHVPPRTELERDLAGIWAQVLGVERVGVHDNFFDLGGHSLLLVRVLGALRARFGAGVPLVDLFRFPTVASLAEHLGRQQPEAPTYAHTQDRARKRQEAADLHRREAAERRRRPQPAGRPRG